MKLLAYLTASLFTSISMIAILFKIMHWPGAGIGIVVGIGGFALIAVPFLAIHKYQSVQ